MVSWFSLSLSLFQLLCCELYHIHVPFAFLFHLIHVFLSHPRSPMHNFAPYSLILFLSLHLRNTLLTSLVIYFSFLPRIILCFFLLYASVFVEIVFIQHTFSFPYWKTSVVGPAAKCDPNPIKHWKKKRQRRRKALELGSPI